MNAPLALLVLLAACAGHASTDDGGLLIDASGPSADADPAVAFCSFIEGKGYAHSSGALFEHSEVVRFDVEMTASDWQYQLDNPDLEEYRPASITFCGETVTNIGMRFKRSTHPNSDLEEGYAKNPIVFDINEFVPGQRLRGVRKLNLEYGDDQALLAQRLNFEMLADFGLDVPRVNHAEVYMNGEYIGVFNHIERIDRSYAKYHWGENDGQLYKHAYCGTFRDRGSNASDYTGDPRCYAPKPSDSVTDYSDIIHVIDVLNNTPEADFANAFAQVWDVDEWIPSTAALQVLAYGDSPNANGNNFYTYYPTDGGKTRFALWDLDAGYFRNGAPCNSGANSITYDLFQHANCFDSLPLFDRVIAVPVWRELFLERAQAFLQGPFSSTTFAARVDALASGLDNALTRDPNRRGDAADWPDVIEDLKTRQTQRAQNVAEQLEAHGL